MNFHDEQTEWIIEKLALMRSAKAFDALEAMKKEEKWDYENDKRPYWGELEAFFDRAIRLHGLVMKHDTLAQAVGEALKEEDDKLVRWAVCEIENLTAKEAVPHLKAALAHYKEEYLKDKTKTRRDVRKLVVGALRGFEIEISAEELNW